MTTTTKEPTILDRITDHLRTYMHFTDADLPLVVGLWILHTWTFAESFPRTPWVTPYLYVFSDGPGAGKSTLIEVVETLVLNAEKAGDMTSAAMYRLIQYVHPTLLVDEVDTVFSGSAKQDDLRRTLNTGYKHGGYTWRTVGGDPEKFETFCPKLLAGIKDITAELPETVQTRSIPVKLEKGKPPQTYYAHIAGPDAQQIAEEISAWIRGNGERIIDYMPAPVDSMEPRAFEISLPLLQIARALGVEREARAALIRLLAPQRPKDKPEVAMLRTIREHFDETGRDRTYSRDVAALFSWTPKHLSQMLKPFGISTERQTFKIDGGPTLKGYYRSQFEEAWRLYL